MALLLFYRFFPAAARLQPSGNYFTASGRRIWVRHHVFLSVRFPVSNTQKERKDMHIFLSELELNELLEFIEFAKHSVNSLIP